MAVVGGQVLTKMAGTTWLSRMNLSLLFTSSHACNSLKYRINGVFLQALIIATRNVLQLQLLYHLHFGSCAIYSCKSHWPISLRNALFLN